MAIEYGVYKVEPGGYASDPLTVGIAPSLTAAAKMVSEKQFKGLKPETKIIDEVTADIVVHKPEFARYKVVILKDRA